MDRKYLDDHHIVARYLADKLSDADRTAFEAYREQHPEIVAELEATARFKVGLAALNAKQELAPLLEPSQTRRSVPLRYGAAFAGLAAAGIVIVAGFNLLKVPVVGLTPAAVSGRLSAELPAGGRYDVIRMRGASPFDAQLTLPTQPAAIMLRVLPEDESAASYRAELREVAASGAKSIAAVGGLVPGDDHFVVLYVNSSRLVRGDYRLIVTSQDAEGRTYASVFMINVIAATG